MHIKIRQGRPEDIPAVYALVKELAEYEKAPEAVTNSVERMTEDAFGKDPCYFLLVAESDTEILGMAIYFVKYSTWKGKGIYLDDIVVSEKHRRKGIGKLLFDEVVREAARLDAHILHWQVLDWNTPAIEFYKKYNCSFESEWIDCKLHREQLLQFNQPSF
ncbi:MAG: GNAT family N-acetyltransferase [Bacteroidia bacterium]|nr:GNAT family N-acetyltransferase [Bacteroidia bacterium]